MINNYIKALRIPEVSLMTGFFVIGAFFGMHNISSYTVFLLIIISLISFFTILSVYSYNAFAGKNTDESNSRLRNLKNLNANIYKISVYIFLSLAIGISFILHWKYAVYCILIFMIWRIYSHPIIGLKHTAYWGTVLHFFAQIIHFNMCYSVFLPISSTSIGLSVYFSIAFSIGHLTHEIIDYESDKKSRSKTTAVKDGVKRVLIYTLALCVINLFVASLLWYFTKTDTPIYVLMIIPVIVQIFLFLAYRKEIIKKSRLVRSLYRIAFLISFLTIIIYRFSQIGSFELL